MEFFKRSRTQRNRLHSPTPYTLPTLETQTTLLFDNGNEHTPQVSRVAEYSLDEHFKSATLVWEYSDPTLYGYALGFAQRLTDGNTLVCFGTAQVIREVSPEGEVVFQMKVTGTELPYRAFKIATLY